MKVFSFRGNCVKDVEHIKHAVNILEEYAKESKLVAVLSATNNTRKALETVTDNFYNGYKDEALKLFDNIKKQHFDTAKYLLILNFNECLEKMVDIFTEVEWLLHDKPVWSYRYYYDQIVCAGELLISRIISAYMQEKGIANTFTDIRDVVRTDNNFSNAHIDLIFTEQKAKELLFSKPENDIIITQGGIGSTDENESTTLGLLGGDYTGAVLAKISEADSFIIWQKTEALTANVFDKKSFIENLNYTDAYAIAINSDHFLHPEALRILKDSNVSTEVSYFYDTSVEGTLLNNQQAVNSVLQAIVQKDNQVLIICKAADSKGLNSKELKAVLESIDLPANIFSGNENLIQIVADHVPDKIEKFAQEAGQFADIHVEKGFRLISFLHSNPGDIDAYISPNNRILTESKDGFVKVLTQ